ncbi:MAG: LysM peptidoglycan-binding domain-containing protein [Verrucomicrobia bacterium]|nr:LysM peptidoglycan-binding domain-containing protein [Verrucomicrobiota bacterium]
MQRQIYFNMLMVSVFSTFLALQPVEAADSVRVAVADLKQDMASMQKEVRALLLEVEQLRRENESLRSALNSSSTQQQMAQLAASLQNLRREFERADNLKEQAIMASVKRQMDSLASQMQNALESVSKAVSRQPKIASKVRFTEDYPQTGVTYTVRSGDTLTKIAREHGSTIKDIQNANKIANPSRDLRVGQSIFIPIAQP